MTKERNNNSEEESRPAQIGPYRILDTLGEGGMSVVYLAEQSEPVKRRVALKILKAGMDSKQVVARFESERQALAVLDHPNIAKIFDGGIAESGRPYFVMEQVKGVPITDYCDSQRLSNEERLGVFIKVCSAVQHAHLKGLIHRDLKPSNILVGDVDGKAEPKIIDFGIAKATSMTLTDSTLHTRIGQIIGTPQYMSPEQAGVTGLDIDTRTDIYSLGVVLYELLVGAVPLDLQAIGDQAMQVALREKDPPKPSTRITELGDTKDEIAKVRATSADNLRRQLSGDLDWIVMRAIEKDRTRRYETTNALAMECRRFLRHEPVLARAPSPGYLLTRFIQRNRLTVVTGLMAILAIVGGATVAVLGYMRATEAEQVATQEAEKAKQVSDFLVELFEVSDPSEARGNTITAREVLDQGAESIEQNLAGEPEVQATLMVTMAKVYQSLGLLDESEELLQSALDIRRAASTGPDALLADVLNELCAVTMLQGELDLAEAFGLEALRIRRTLHGNDHEDVGSTLSNLATVDYYQAEYESSLELFRQSLDVFERTLGKDHLDVINTMSSLGSLYWRTGDLKEAERLQRIALEGLRQTEGNDHPDVAVMLNNLAILMSDLGRNDEAEPLHLEALAMQRRQLGEHPLVANSMNNLGMFYMENGEFDKAEPMMLEALAMWRRTLGDGNPKISIAQNNLGQLKLETRQFGDAEQYLLKALAGHRAGVGDDHEDVALTSMYLCDVYNLTGRFAECETTISGVISTFERTLPPGHRRIAAAKIRLAISLAGRGAFDGAEQLMLDNYAVFEKTVPGTSDEARSRRWVVLFYSLWGKPDEAARYSE